MGNRTKKDTILIKGARLHNLKNISFSIDKDKFIVISGVSGSGKSSLAIHTLFAEGQRRYIESLSSYARQFLGKLKKPEVDEIKGMCPAIAIEQKVVTKNPRSTLATVTEIYEYLKLLFSRIGKTFSPISGNQVKQHRIKDVLNFIYKQKTGKSLIILAEYKKDYSSNKILNTLIQQGFSKIMLKDKIYKIKDLLESKENRILKNKIQIVIDRITIENLEEKKSRITDSLEAAFYEGEGECSLFLEGEKYIFSNKFELDGMEFEKPTTNLFSSNNPYGACKKCEGFGSILGIDERKVIANDLLSIKEEVVSCWIGKKLSRWKDRFILHSSEYNFPVNKPYNKLSKKEKELLWNGKGKCKGIYQFFRMLEKDKYKIQNRVLIARYRGKTKCFECMESGLRKDAGYVKVGGKNIQDILQMSIQKALKFFNTVSLDENDKLTSKRLITEIVNRLDCLNQIGLGYITLNRKSSTLSGGEYQRMNLATSLGSSLVGAMYVLDEPSIGLHSKDTERLIAILKNLRDIGNTLIVIEHDEDIMMAADEIIDLGPEAGHYGGKIIYQGLLKKIGKNSESLTAKYLSKKMAIEIPLKRKKSSHFIRIKGIKQYNLDNISVEFPLHCLTVVTGMSGSGKSTLVKEILEPALSGKLNYNIKRKKNFKEISINTDQLKKIEFVSHNPIGKSSRSNPVTYIKAYDDIRLLFAKQPLSQHRNYTAGFFSFNIDGGRCPECSGDGRIVIEMQFMADVHLECEKCKGSRFKKEILKVRFQNKNISEVLSLSVEEAIPFFKNHEENLIAKKLQPLKDVGLGYVRLGQASNTLSGGEAQRIKLASFLNKGDSLQKTLFIFDEPTTGLHFHDINKLLNTFYALIDKGHSIICIEHNLDVIKCADWVIDLGPEGGENGGKVIFKGTPEDLINCKDSITGLYLKKKLESSVKLDNLVV